MPKGRDSSLYSSAYGLRAHSRSLGGQFFRQNLRGKAELTLLWTIKSIIAKKRVAVSPCGWISLIVRRARCVDALVTPSHVETHPVCTTLNVLFQAFIYVYSYKDQKWATHKPLKLSIFRFFFISHSLEKLTLVLSAFLIECLNYLTLAGFAIGHKAIAAGTQTPMATWCVHTFVLTCIPLFTLVNI